MPSSKALKAGDRVAVPWGLDSREGEVVAIYRTGAVDRVVVKLAMLEDSGDESPTVVLPADAIQLLNDDAAVPAAGTWLPGFRYEREVAAALARVTSDLEARIQLNAQQPGAEVEVDILLESQQGTLVVEVKATDHLSERSFEATISQLRAAMKSYGSSKGMLVAASALPSSIRKKIGSGGLLYPNLGVVRWRGAEDDRRLYLVVSALLSDHSTDQRVADG